MLTISKTFLLTLLLAGTVSAQIVTGSSSSGSGITQGFVIDATVAPYNVTSGNTVSDAAITSGQANFTCPNNDCNFTAVQNGWICFATNLTTDESAGTSVVILPQGTLTVTGAQAASCSGGNATQSANPATLMWGPDVTTGANAAWAAAEAKCTTVMYPGGYLFVQSAIANTSNDSCIVSKNYATYGITGSGPQQAQFVPTPNFSSSSCTGGSASNGCFFGADDVNISNVGIWGGGNSAIGSGFNGKAAFVMMPSIAETGSNQIVQSVLLASWGSNTTGFIGIEIGALSNPVLLAVHNDGVGYIGCEINSSVNYTIATFYNVYCAVNAQYSIYMASANQIISYGGFYGYTTLTSGGNTALEMAAGAYFYSYGDRFIYTSGTGNSSGSSVCTSACGAGFLYADGSEFSNSIGSAYGLTLQGGMTAHIRDSILTESGSSGTALYVCATCKVYDEGGNTITASSGTAVNLLSGGQYVPAPNATTTFTGTATTVVPVPTGSGACATITTVSGNGNAGVLTCTGTTGSSTIVLTPLFTAPHGFSCNGQDHTTVVDILTQTAVSTTTCTLSGTVAANDVISYTATPY
jgi:hypothetical protein